MFIIADTENTESANLNQSLKIVYKLCVLHACGGEK